MIRGVVTDDLEAWVDLAVVEVGRPSVGFSAVIDTGFNGYLTLPMAVLEKYQAKPLIQVAVTLADGSQILSQLFELFFARWELRGRRITRMRVMECLAYVARSFHDRDSRSAHKPINSHRAKNISHAAENERLWRAGCRQPGQLIFERLAALAIVPPPSGSPHFFRSHSGQSSCCVRPNDFTLRDS